MSATSATLDIDPDTFLKHVWQRRPCLLRGAFPQWQNPLAPDDLAALACLPAVESRVVRRERRNWQLDHGPFKARYFARLPEKRWTLLVQAVDQQVPEVAALLDAFRFIPDWRVDDVMVSYAEDGGGVGPHFDHYDVFLIQGLGRRRWRVGQRCDSRTPLRPHADLRLLARFDTTQEWVLEAGDMLYLPPGWAHDGVAVGGDCMTYSVGLRAPSRAELVAHWCDEVISWLEEDDRYTDAALDPRALPGELTPATLARLHGMVRTVLDSEFLFGDWFARYSTESKYADSLTPPAPPLTAALLRQRLARGARLRRDPASRYAMIRRGARGISLYVDGEMHVCQGPAEPVAETLCGRGERALGAADLPSGPARRLALTLYNQGALQWEDDEDDEPA